MAQYWQREPLLVRGAVRDWPARLSGGELAGLALDETVESRVVMGDTAAEDWILLHGPFSDEFFADTPERDWTLLVQDVDKHLPAFSRLLAWFDFVPAWRLDDLMISYAAPGGTVGPHVDNYDVFLLQAEGHRRWSVQTAIKRTPRTRMHGDLRLVSDFRADYTWELGPGDMLYLPPGIPHFGVASDEAMTYSIGFRAPSASELLGAWARWLAESAADDPRFMDPGRMPGAAPGALDADSLASLRGLLRQASTVGDASLNDWIGRYLSEPKHPFRDVAPDSPPAADTIGRALDKGRRLVRNPAVRFLYTADDENQPPRVFVHGRILEATATTAVLARRIADGDAVGRSDIAESGAFRREQLAALAAWYAHGWIWFEDDLR